LKKFGSIAVLERDQYLGNGATGKCAGGIRAQFSSEVNVRMSMLSEDKFESFTEEMGAEVQFDQVGYLFMLNSDEQVEFFKKQYEMWQSVGHPVQWLNPEEIKELAPAVDVNDLKAGTYSPRDGIGDPHQFTQGYVNASKRLGVKYILETEATGIHTEGDRIAGVKTSNGIFATDKVVNASGPHAAKIASWLGVELPVKPIKRQIVTTAPLDFIPDSFPMVVDVSAGLYAHKESGGLLMGWADKSTPEGFDESVDPEYTDAILMKGLERIPQLETAEIKTSWGGLYSVTQDHHAILDVSPDHPGFYHAVGFSGHGFMHAPAVGIVMAEMICGEKMTVDISRLSLSRFKAEVPAEESVVI
jgi:sarcosine oxidase subunit beta